VLQTCVADNHTLSATWCRQSRYPQRVADKLCCRQVLQTSVADNHNVCNMLQAITMSATCCRQSPQSTLQGFVVCCNVLQTITIKCLSATRCNTCRGNCDTVLQTITTQCWLTILSATECLSCVTRVTHAETILRMCCRRSRHSADGIVCNRQSRYCLQQTITTEAVLKHTQIQ